ncbi:MAG: hypothetical protein HY858_07550 [Candidatus Solibacter usitatus]|nr:hypothetical protein [Candidatus Solibacter usitatus]
MRINHDATSLGSLLERMPRQQLRSDSNAAAQVVDFSAQVTADTDRSERRASSPSALAAAPPPAAAAQSRLETHGSESSPVSAQPRATASSPRAATEAPAAVVQPAFSLQEPTPAAVWPITMITPAVPPPLAIDSKSALAAELAKAGVDITQLKVGYWEELVWFPGGNYVNRTLTVEAPNGQKMDFDASATLKSPHVTARDVLSMFSA